MATLTRPSDRVKALARNLTITTDLVGSDHHEANPEYLRALSEYACTASGISTDHKESVIALAIDIGEANDPAQAIEDLAHNLTVAADLIGEDMKNVHPEYVRALSEHTCYASGISGDHAELVRNIFTDILARN